MASPGWLGVVHATAAPATHVQSGSPNSTPLLYLDLFFRCDFSTLMNPISMKNPRFQEKKEKFELEQNQIVIPIAIAVGLAELFGPCPPRRVVGLTEDVTGAAARRVHVARGSAKMVAVRDFGLERWQRMDPVERPIATEIAHKTNREQHQALQEPRHIDGQLRDHVQRAPLRLCGRQVRRHFESLA